jgi:V8-like Glu-specific endopeptidase
MNQSIARPKPCTSARLRKVRSCNTAVILVLIGFSTALTAAQSAAPRKDIPTIAKAANGAVVSIVMSDKDGRPVAQGTGFLVSTDGRIVTNYHVIQHGSSAVIKLPDGAFFVVDGVLAADKVRDIAVIKAHGNNFRTVSLGDSDSLQVGEEVVAIGNPLSLESTVSNGILSGMRSIEKEGGKLLQITAPISPGSSGGPLFNMVGEVVGITTLHIKGGENLNFAIPINDLKPILQTSFSKLADFPNNSTAHRAPTPSKADKATPSEWTTARVIGIEHAIITEPGYSVEDYAACMKSTADWPDSEDKKAVVEEQEKTCKKLDELHKSEGMLPGYYPPKKEPGYVVTFETPTARYILSTVGRCTKMVENGQCGGEWVPDVAVGQSYIFYPPRAGETQLALSDPPVKEGAVPEVRLIGHLESVIEKKKAE